MPNEVRIKLTDSQRFKIKKATGKDMTELRVSSVGGNPAVSPAKKAISARATARAVAPRAVARTVTPRAAARTTATRATARTVVPRATMRTVEDI
jgi:hypothetical protein